jgi:hypothetical protein
MFPRPLSLRPATVALAIISALVCCPGRTAFAGTIGFRVNATVTVAEQIDMAISIEHTGDEAALEVHPIVELEGQSAAGTPIQSLAPDGAETWNLTLAREGLRKGVYIAVIRVRYADGNGYPFEILATASVVVDQGKSSNRVRGSLRTQAVPQNSSAASVLTLETPKGRSGYSDVQIVMPSGLSVRPDSFRVDFSDTKKHVFDLTVTNKNLLLGTSVNVFALVTSSNGASSQTDLIRGNVRVTRAVERLTTKLLLQTALALSFLLVSLEIYSRRSSL